MGKPRNRIIRVVYDIYRRLLTFEFIKKIIVNIHKLYFDIRIQDYFIFHILS